MRPIARILLRCGVTWKELAELVKLVYVDVATTDYGKHGRPANASRVAILTGLSRRDVKRARDAIEAGAEALDPMRKINHASRARISRRCDSVNCERTACCISLFELPSFASIERVRFSSWFCKSKNALSSSFSLGVS